MNTLHLAQPGALTFGIYIYITQTVGSDTKILLVPSLGCFCMPHPSRPWTLSSIIPVLLQVDVIEV